MSSPPPAQGSTNPIAAVVVLLFVLAIFALVAYAAYKGRLNFVSYPAWGGYYGPYYGPPPPYYRPPAALSVRI